MLMTAVIIGAVVWVPVLFYEIGRRGLVVLLLWLFMAPIVANLVDYRSSTFRVRWDPGSITAVRAFEGERNRRVLLAPNRLLLGAFGVVFALQALLRKRRLGPFDRTEKLMGVFTVLLLFSVFSLSTVLGYSLRVAIDAFIVPFISYFVARRLITTEAQFNRFIVVLSWMGAYLVVMALMQGLQGDVSRVTGPFAHRDYLYVVMIVVFFMMLASNIGSGKGKWDTQPLTRWLRWFVVSLVPVVIFLTWTRGNWLGFAFGGWVFFALSFRLMNFRRGVSAIALIAMLVPMILLGAQEFAPSEFMADRISNERNVYARLAAWRAVLSSGMDQPILGLGLGNTREVLAETTVRFEGTKNLSSTHNSFLALFSELGAVGLLVYLAILGSVIRMGLSLYKRGQQPWERWQGVAVVSIMAAHLVPAFFSNILFSPVISHCYVFAFAGAIAGLCCSRAQERSYIRCPRVIQGSLVRDAVV